MVVLKYLSVKTKYRVHVNEFPKLKYSLNYSQYSSGILTNRPARVKTSLRERQESLVWPKMSRVTSCYCLLGRIFYSTINGCVNVCFARVTLKATALSPAGNVKIVYSIIILNKT